MKKKNNKKVVILIVTVILLFLIALLIAFVLNKDNDKNEIQAVKKVDEMKDYDYYLEEDATEYYKKLYNELKDILKKDEIDKEEYAKTIAKLFVTDVFTLDNKISSNDIGGLQFIYTDFKDDFIKIAQTTLYSSVESNIYGDRVQELPIVINTLVTNIKKSTFTYKDNEYDSYEVSLNIEYEKDLGYPKEYNLILINNDKYLQIVKAE